jgi:hypothetical protein
LIFALVFSRLSQSYDPAYSNKVQPLLVKTFGNKPIEGLTKGERAEMGKTQIIVALPLKQARLLKVVDTLTVERNDHSFKAFADRINLALYTSRVSEIYLLPQEADHMALISGELVHVVIEKSSKLDQCILLPFSPLSEYGRSLWSVYSAKPNTSSDGCYLKFFVSFNSHSALLC